MNDTRNPAEQAREKSYRALRREIRFVEAINCLLGVGMLLVALAAYRIAGDTGALKQADANISGLATEAGREAREMHAELGQLERRADSSQAQLEALRGELSHMKLQAGAFQTQVSATQGQIEEARNQTAAIARQTAAMQVHNPLVALSAVELNGLGEAPQRDGLVHATFHNHFTNAGGSVVNSPRGQITILFAKALPATRPAAGATYRFDGDYMSFFPGAQFGPGGSYPFTVSRQMADDVLAGRLTAFLYGRTDYLDLFGSQHSYCFAYAVPVKGGHTTGILLQAGGPSYHCQT